MSSVLVVQVGGRFRPRHRAPRAPRATSPSDIEEAAPPPVSAVLASCSSQMRISTISASEPLVLLNILSCAVGSSVASTAKIKLEDYNVGRPPAICNAACLILPAARPGPGLGFARGRVNKRGDGEKDNKPTGASCCGGSRRLADLGIRGGLVALGAAVSTGDRGRRTGPERRAARLVIREALSYDTKRGGRRYPCPPAHLPRRALPSSILDGAILDGGMIRMPE